MDFEIIKDDVNKDFLDYYKHDFYCLNCGTHNQKYVRKGHQVHGLKTECDYCGCVIRERSGWR